MEIVDVKLDKQKANPKFGTALDYISFDVLVNDGDPDDEPTLHIRVSANQPKDPMYKEVKKWYDAQKKKPFNFEFVDGRSA